MAQKAMTLRLDSELYDKLQLVAGVLGQSTTMIIRTALAQHLNRLEENAAFQEKLEWQLNRIGELKR